MIKLILGLLLSFLLTIILMPIIIKIAKKLSCSQTILKYVEEHKAKQGTPTMGGLIFFIVTFAIIFIFLDYDTNWFMCLMTGFCFAVLGFMDDYLKVKNKRNRGLFAYQKIIGQVGISLIFSLFVYYKIGTTFYIPFFNTTINGSWFIIVIVLLTLIATTNSVNLTDGLDGLASTVSVVVIGITITIFALMSKNAKFNMISLQDYKNLMILLAIFSGSILGFLVFNTNKASIFMGDVGSLGIGGLIATVYCITGLELSLLIVGVMYVVSSLSVIIQVVSFKKFHKRVFKMAPLHHHFQQLGYSESKITYCYSMITGVLGLLLIVSYL